MELFGHLTYVLVGKLCCSDRITKLNLCLAFGDFFGVSKRLFIRGALYFCKMD